MIEPFLDPGITSESALLRSVLASSGDCIKVLDLDGKLVFMTEGAKAAMEVNDFEAIRGCPWPDFWHDDGNAAAQAAVAKARAGGRGAFQGAAETMGGTRRWWDVQVTSIFGPDGFPEKLLSISRDITAQHDAEERLRELNESLERKVREHAAERDRLWHSSHDLLVNLDINGTLLSVNPAATVILGWTAEEMIGRSIFSLILDDDPTLATEAFVSASQKTSGITENRILHKDGGYRWISWVAAAEGNRIFAIGRHVTAAKEAAQALAQLASERDSIWRNSRDVITVIDSLGKLKSVNPAAMGVLGWSPDEMLDHNILEFIHPEDAPPLRGGAFIPERYAQPTVFPNRLRHKDGHYRHMSWMSVRSSDGLIYSSGRDITVEKEQADALRAAEDSLRQSQKMEAVGQLTGGIAHDFNNLLTGISGSLEVMESLLADGRPGDVPRYVNAAQGAARRAAALTDRLLAFSRRQKLDQKPANVNRLLTDMEDLIRRTIGPAITLEVVGAASLWSAFVDQNQLENALLNLCINARDAMPDGGRMTIETANKWLDDQEAGTRDLEPGQYLSVCVSDSGTGMTPEVISHAFDPFFTTKPLGAGTGLGLSMVYGFVRQSGGQVRIYSEIDLGTTVCLYLPRHLGDVQDAEVLDVCADLTQVEEGETVLVVDDEPTVRMVATTILQKAGFAVLEAGAGDEGLRILQSNVRIDLLITDVGLPGGMNGRQMADAARMFRTDLRVLFITGYAENAVVGNGHLEQGMAILTKPFGMKALVAKVRSTIDGSGRDFPQPLS